MIVYRPIPPLSTGRGSLWSVLAAMASAALLGPTWPSDSGPKASGPGTNPQEA